MRQLSTGWRRFWTILTLCLAAMGLAAGILALARSTAANTDPTVYLPIVVGGSGSTGGGALSDGGTVTGVDGVTIGAVSGTLTSTLAVTITQTAAPTLTLPGGAQAHGNYYHLSARRDVYTFGDNTFILGLPVPAGTPTDTLGIALYEPDDGEDPAGWSILPGLYDAPHELMLVVLPYLSIAGQTVTLIEHPGLHSPLNTSPTALPSSPEHGENGLPASTSGTQFQVLCILADEIDREICELDAGAVESEFETFLGNLVSIGYPHPLIYTQAEAFDIDNPTVIQSITYVVSIAPDSNRCQNNRESGLMGFYRHRMQQIILCLIPNAPLLDSYKHLIRHEYYHATQVAFPNTEADFTLWSWEKWIIEGTASVAERSDQFGLKRTPAKSLHYVDRSLKSEEGTDEYKAQDFWVFLGQASGSALDRFITLFQQGATTADVANWIGSLDGLKNWYWRWVKNQVMVEENITFEGELGQTCTLQSQVVESMRTFDLYNDGMHLGTLPPMTSHVIKLEIAPELEGFPQIWVWVNDEPFNGPDPDLKYKVYVDGETCTSIPDYNRYLHNITAAKDYYVVVSNTNPDSSKNYTVFFD